MTSDEHAIARRDPDRWRRLPAEQRERILESYRVVPLGPAMEGRGDDLAPPPAPPLTTPTRSPAPRRDPQS